MSLPSPQNPFIQDIKFRKMVRLNLGTCQYCYRLPFITNPTSFLYSNEFIYAVYSDIVSLITQILRRAYKSQTNQDQRLQNPAQSAQTLSD